MAFQTLTSTDVASPSSTALNNLGSSDGADLNNRNSVPFSFLIAFLALFVVFMGLGLWARRIVFFARRRLGLPVPDEQPFRRQVARPKRPVLWDVYPDQRVQPKKWERFQVSILALYVCCMCTHALQPLSLWSCKEVPVDEHKSMSAYVPEPPPWPPAPPALRSLPRTRGPGVMIVEPPSAPPSSPRGPRTLREHFQAFDDLKEWWLDIAHPMRHMQAKTETTEKKPEEVHVAVFIAMPSHRVTLSKRVSGGGAEQLGEIALGISSCAWEYGDTAVLLQVPEVPQTLT